MISKAFNDLIRGLSLYKIWTYQAWYEISAKYRRTFLGSLWMAGHMVTMGFALSLVFGAILNLSLKELLPHILGGILVWGMISFILTDATNVFVTAGQTIRNNAYPFTYYIFEAVAGTFFFFLNNLVVFYVVMALVGVYNIPHWSILIGLPIILVTIFCWGTVVAMFSARFRDLRYMLPNIGSLVYYLTPIMWRANDMNTGKSKYVYLNPFAGLLEMVRAPLLGEAPAAHTWAGALFLLFSGIIVFIIAFSLCRKRIPFWV